MLSTKSKILLLVWLCALGVVVAIVFLSLRELRDVVVVVEDVYFTDVADVNSVVEPNEPEPIGELISMPIP